MNEMENPIVSIIIPIYNVSAYVDACVASAIKQTYPHLEIILVDDGSPDDCPEKCDAWGLRDSRIRVIHKNNGGLSDARNAGLEIATGKYVYFLDGDDTIEPNLVETVVAHMEEGVDLVAFHYNNQFEDGKKEPLRYHELGMFQLPDEESRVDFILRYLVQGLIGWEAWSRMYRRDQIERYHLRFADNRVIFAEDLYFCLCYCAHARKILSIEQCLYNYLQRSDSIMRKDSPKINVGRMNELCKAALSYFGRHDCKGLIEKFPVIHLLIVMNLIEKVEREGCPKSQIRRRILSDVEDKRFFKKQLRQVRHYTELLYSICSGWQAANRICLAKYLADGFYPAYRLRKMVINRSVDQLSQKADVCHGISKIYEDFSKNPSKIYLIGTEDFGNIGDHQISVAIQAYLQKKFPDAAILEITDREYQRHCPWLERYIAPEDLIILTGGGNFGDAYKFTQAVREDVITRWRKNPKLVFPQTVHFSDTQEGRESLKKSKAIYTKENRVILCVREKYSYEDAKDWFSCDVELFPDIVLSCDLQKQIQRKEQVLFCLRRDAEKSISPETEASVRNILAETALHLVDTDLQLDYHVSKKQRGEVIETALAQFRESKLVITDRLHGMIFATITGAPCIVFSNNNHKIRGTYEWLKRLPYIRYAETVEDAKQAISALLMQKPYRYDPSILLPHYDRLGEVLERLWWGEVVE